MTSTVTSFSSTIDTAFPVPGADNDTSGFRDNFGAIKNALASAASEITDLQVIQSALISLASSEPASSKGKAGDIQGQLYANSTTLYVCYANYVNTTTNIWAKVSTVGGSW